MQRHYDADGNLVGTTEVESPWDEATRAEAEALWEAEQLVCPSCGNLREDCSDPERPWFPQRHVCYASRAREVADRKWGEKHKGKPFHTGGERVWAQDYSPRTPFHFRDGTRVYVAPYDVNPDDHFI